MFTRSLALLSLVLLTACTAVGPTASQNAAGQTTKNSPLDTTLMTVLPDGTNTFSATARGPVRESLVDNEGIEARSTGMVTRDVIWSDGINRLSIASGSDITAEGVKVHPATGVVEIARFTTSSSEPMRALNEALDRYKDVWSKLSEEQRKTIEVRYAALVESVKVIAPVVGEAIEKLLVPVP